jgi:hypothetical protein
VKIRYLVLICAIAAASAATYANSVPSRSSSSYGTQSNIDTGIGLTGTGFQEEVVCNPQNSDPGYVGGVCTGGTTSGYDLLLSITSDSIDGTPLTITLPSFLASSTNGVGGGYSFGVLECALNSDGTVDGNAPVTIGSTTFCTATQSFNGTSLVPTSLAGTASTCETDLSSLANGTDTLTLPGACITNGMTFFFDETSPNTTASPATTPEPGTLVILGAGLLALAGAGSKRFGYWFR